MKLSCIVLKKQELEKVQNLEQKTKRSITCKIKKIREGFRILTTEIIPREKCRVCKIYLAKGCINDICVKCSRDAAVCWKVF